MTKPILFNTEMVQAILEGRKTVTRRVVKFIGKRNPRWTGYIPDGQVLYGSNNIPAAKSQYCPGDILFVRETWAKLYSRQNPDGRYVYKANDSYPFGEDGYIVKFRWHPSIHMPREAARIWLRVTDVRVERLHDIEEDGAKAEGLCVGWGSTPKSSKSCSARQAFMWLWDSTINPADRNRYGWAANPRVWAIEFKRCEKPEEAGG